MVKGCKGEIERERERDSEKDEKVKEWGGERMK